MKTHSIFVKFSKSRQQLPVIGSMFQVNSTTNHYRSAMIKAVTVIPWRHGAPHLHAVWTTSCLVNYWMTILFHLYLSTLKCAQSQYQTCCPMTVIDYISIVKVKSFNIITVIDWYWNHQSPLGIELCIRQQPKWQMITLCVNHYKIHLKQALPSQSRRMSMIQQRHKDFCFP